MLIGLVSLGSMIAFFVVDGRENVLALYIPLDLAVVGCKTFYYFYIRYVESIKKKDAKRLARQIQKKKKQEAGFKEPLLGVTRGSQVSNVSNLSDQSSNASA